MTPMIDGQPVRNAPTTVAVRETHGLLATPSRSGLEPSFPVRPIRCSAFRPAPAPSIRFFVHRLAHFDPCFFQTPLRGGSPCIITRPSPPSGWPKDFHLEAAEHAQHTTKPLRGS